MLSKEGIDRLFKTAESAFANQSRRLDGFISEENFKAIKEVGTKAMGDCQQAINAGRDLIDPFRPVR